MVLGMIGKKAQVEMQFNWIFVLIVGTVLLAFFFVLISKQTNNSDQQISASLSRHFTTVIKTNAQRSGTVKAFNVPRNVELEFTCDSERQIHQYTLNDLKGADIKYDIIFAPSYLQNSKLYTWTEEWVLPSDSGFGITSMLYLTNPNHGYFFYNETPNSNSAILRDEFPKNFSVHYIDDDNVDGKPIEMSSKNYDTYTNVLLTEDIPNNNPFISDTGDSEYVKQRFIVIHPRENYLFSYGEICYCPDYSCVEKWKDGSDLDESSGIEGYKTACTSADGEYTHYMGKASLYGAIISKDANYYDCMMNKAFDKLRITTLMQYYRINKSADLLPWRCRNDLGVGVAGPMGWLEKLNTTLSTGFKIEGDPVGESYKLIKKLALRNRQLALQGNCIQLY